jgi:class 3 adenylate cyclase/tetratricopeptide (TPR) repeat protein
MRACAVCGVPSPEGARFCSSCGAAIARDEEEAGRVRKVVTVVFSDLAGSTGLGERLDPESLTLVMGRYFERTRAVLERHGATVQKFIGDAVMAVFGIPVVHEDDALRAVRAAAELPIALAELNAELVRDHGVSLELRTGVNTGEVLAGDPAAAQALALGDTVNVAARLEQVASSGEILLGQATWALVRDAVDVTALDPLILKGKRAPVGAWRLERVNPAMPGRVRRLDRPLVGREAERARLISLAEEAAGSRSCLLATMVGPAGVGKSRLVAEVLTDLEGTARVLTGRCLPYGEGITFWPVAEAVRQAAGVVDSDGPAEARAKLANLLDGDPEAKPIAERIAQVIGLEDTAGPVQDAAWALRRLLEALARERLVVLVLDDLHWAEPTLLEVLEHIAEWSRVAPILVLCVARPELLERHPTWVEGKSNATTVLLEPLEAEESARLLDGLVGGGPLDAEARTRITNLAGGNPLFMEELLAMLVEAGRLEQRDGGWRLAGEPLNVPPTIQALLAARLDQLDAGERGVLTRASVVGQEFEQNAVEELSPPAVRPRVHGRLLDLVAKQLLRTAASTLLASEAFQFRHLLLRDAAYEAVPKARRAELHERFAGWLEVTMGERAREYAEIIGYHYEQAVRYLAELGPIGEHARAVGGQAAVHLGVSGTRAVARGDMRAAANMLSRATALYPEGDPRGRRLLPDLAHALSQLGEFDRASEVLDRAKREAAATDDRAVEAEVLLARAWLDFIRDLDRWPAYAEAQAKAAISIFHELKDEQGLARAWQLMAETFWVRCQVAASEAAQLRAIEHARRAGDHREEAQNWGILAGSAIYGPLPVEDGIRRCEEVIARFGDNPSVRARTTRALACLWAMHGEFDRARELIQTARAMFVDLGQTYALASSAESSGLVEMLAGDLSAAEQELRRGVDLLEGMGERAYLSTLGAMLADVLELADKHDEADRFARTSQEASDPDDIDSQARWRTVKAKLLAKQGRLEEAETLAREAVDLAAPTDVLNLHGHCYLALGAVLQASGRQTEAGEAFTEAVRAFDRKGNLAAASQTRARMPPARR